MNDQSNDNYQLVVDDLNLNSCMLGCKYNFIN